MNDNKEIKSRMAVITCFLKNYTHPMPAMCEDCAHRFACETDYTRGQRHTREVLIVIGVFITVVILWKVFF